MNDTYTWIEPDADEVGDVDEGYCYFIHVSHAFDGCDEGYDPGRGNEWSGEYGPYQIASFAEAIPSGSCIYYVMSTWNPYNVVLMRSDLVFESLDLVARGTRASARSSAEEKAHEKSSRMLIEIGLVRNGS